MKQGKKVHKRSARHAGPSSSHFSISQPAEESFSKDREALQESLAKYEAIIQAFDGLMYICSPEYEVEFMNEHFIERTGRNPVGEKCYRALHDRDEVCPWCVNDRIQKGETVRWEVKSPKDNRWYYVVNTPIRHPDGSISKMSMIQDVHERKKAEEELRRHERMLNNILSFSPQGIAYFENGRLVWTNQAMEEIFREPEDIEHQRRRAEDFYATEQEYQRVREIFFRSLAHGSPASLEAKFRRYDGTIFEGDIKIAALDPEDPKKGTIAAISDISERKKAERTLRERTEALSRSNSDLEQFAYVAAHDLREPLLAIAAYLKVLERSCKGRLGAEEERIITKALDVTCRMDALIQTLLAYSRLVTAAQPARQTDCKEILEAALANLRPAIEESHARITYDELPTVLGNPSLLVQLFQNLIANAIKFRSAQTPRIHVGVARKEDEWHFWVSDNGIGIEPPHFERIFLLFQRLHTGSEYLGTGIGLANCRKIVERHGGRIWVESKVGEGSTFFFTIPHKTDGEQLLP